MQLDRSVYLFAHRRPRSDISFEKTAAIFSSTRPPFFAPRRLRLVPRRLSLRVASLEYVRPGHAVAQQASKSFRV